MSGRKTGKDAGSDRKVGYGNPPEHTRFKPGQSGNPLGRPYGTRIRPVGAGPTFAETVLSEERPVGSLVPASVTAAGAAHLIAAPLAGPR